MEFSVLEFIFHYVLFLPGNVSRVCRQDSGVTLFRECPSWYLIWNSAAMDVIVTGETSVISQSVSLAVLQRDTKLTHNLCFAWEKRSTHTGLLHIRRTSVDYRHLNWNKLEFWHLSFIFLMLLYVNGDELCQLVPVCFLDLLTSYLTQLLKDS